MANNLSNTHTTPSTDLLTLLSILKNSGQDLTSVTTGDTVLAGLMDNGLSTESVVQLLQMIGRNMMQHLTNWKSW